MQDLKKERRFIFSAILAITLFGLLMVYESSSIYAFKVTDDQAYFFKKQFFSFLLGLGLFFCCLRLDLEFLRKYNKEFLVFTILLLFLVIFFGKRAGGAKRWLSMGAFSFQASELLKISFVVYCADYYRRKRSRITSLKLGVVPFLIVLGFLCFLVLLQPDLGTAIFWLIWAIFFLWFSGAKKKHLAGIILVGLVFSVFLIKFYPYRFRRIIAYFSPFSDPQGAGFQLIQSQIAYGEGGILGLGLGAGRQKLFFLPAAYTDFVFSIIAEEFGLIGSLGLLGVFFLIFHKMFKIAKASRGSFRKGVLWGVIFVFFIEVTVNIGVSCGLLPTKGLPLPFMSYGGSNLVVHYILLGLFFNASRYLPVPNKRILKKL